MHPLAFITAASALITGTTAVDLMPPSLDLPPGPVGKPEEPLDSAMPRGWDIPECKTQYPGFNYKTSELPKDQEPYRNLTLEVWKEWDIHPGGSTIAGGPKECLSLLGPIRRAIGANIYVCNDNADEIHLEQDDMFLAMSLIEEFCGLGLKKAAQVFNHERNWNMIARGVDKKTGHWLE